MKLLREILIVIGLILIIGYLIPYGFENPVEGATRNDYNQLSYWYYPWGTSVTHKGVDIFKKKGTPVHPASEIEWVLYAGKTPGKGGNVVVTLAPKWRLHYYAHLDQVDAAPLSVVNHSSTLGTAGNSGNAANTPSHLHFGIGSLIPKPWDMDKSPDGWKKIFYINPVEHLNKFHEKNRQPSRHELTNLE